MLYDKPATTVEDQIAMLIGRGLQCDDTAQAVRQMRAIGYYRLSAYWLPFEEPAAQGETRSKRFKPGIAWEDIVSIYVFDRKLRLLVMEAIERVEVAVRSSWTNRLTLAHGAHVHMRPEQFNDPWKHAAMLARTALDIDSSVEVFIKHYKEKYSQPYMPPLWGVSETFTLGQLSTWFAATKDLAVRKAVAKDLGLPSKEVLESVLQVLALTRNICAHHGRLWNRRFVKRLPTIKRLRSELMFEIRGPADRTQTEPQNLIYNTLVVLLNLLNGQNADSSYPVRLAVLMNSVSNEQRAAMGFPADWRTRGVWATS
jgi:abortive infection bacteriophage resistance protein